MQKKRVLWVFLAMVVLGGIILSIPPVGERVFAQVDELRVRIRAFLFPVTDEAFVPGGEKMPTITPGGGALTSTVTLQRVLTHTPITPQPTFTPTLTPTALPPIVALKGVRWETQTGGWNYCAPTNLSMILSYWGWKGDKLVTGKYLKPFDYDLNVMPYEMQDYVTEKTNLGVVVRAGGTVALVKTLIANGFPVLIEKGVYFHETATGQLGWMGHYQVMTGYDDQKHELIAQDSFVKADYPQANDVIEQEWRSFNFTFLVVYSLDKKDQLFRVLGEYADEKQSYELAKKRATEEIYNLTGIDLYYAWFNRGSSLVKLMDYAGGAEAFDQAFKLYPTLPDDRRPWRMLWYQTSPYFAYYYSGRYQDVISLATNTLDFIKKRAVSLGIDKQPQVGPYLEETWYWRAKARQVVGDGVGAVEDLKMAVKYHPGFAPAVEELKRLGVAIN